MAGLFLAAYSFGCAGSPSALQLQLAFGLAAGLAFGLAAGLAFGLALAR
jgi:hypothetical protein